MRPSPGVPSLMSRKSAALALRPAKSSVQLTLAASAAEPVRVTVKAIWLLPSPSATEAAATDSA